MMASHTNDKSLYLLVNLAYLISSKEGDLKNLSRDLSEIIRGSARGSLVLLAGQIITAVISTITIIWMTRVLGPTAYGQYTIVLLPVSIAALFQDLGMNTALMRFCALYRHERRNKELKTVVFTGLLFSIVTSVIFSFAIYLFASPIASVFLKRPDLVQMVQAAALAVLGGGGLLTTIQAILVGYEMMGLRSISQILWSITRTVFTFIFLLIGMGAFGAVLAFTVSQLLAGFIGTILLFLFIKFERDKATINWNNLKDLLKYGFPMSIGSLLGGILVQVYSSLMVIYVSTDLIGNYGAATNFGILISFIMVPISTTLFPLFSKFKKTDPQLRIIFTQSVKYTAMITLPAVFVLIALSSPIIRVIYGVDYPYAAQYLNLFILTYAWEGLGGISLSSAIIGVGESKVAFRTSVYTFITGVVLALFLSPIFGMIGILVTMIIAPRTGWLYGIIWAKRNLDITVDWDSTLKIYFTALIAFFATYALVSIPGLQDWTYLIAGGLLYLFVYLFGLPISGALKKNDFTQFETIISGLGPIGRIGSSIMSLISRFSRS